MPEALGGLATLYLDRNQLTSVPAELGGLTSLEEGRCRLTQ